MKKAPRAQRLAEQTRLVRLVPQVWYALREIPGVVGVGVGAKEVGGEATDEFAFRIYVGQKRPADDLGRSERIPSRLLGVPTDVLVKHACEELVDNAKYRPLKGGVMAKNEFVHTDDRLLSGTLGCLVERKTAAKEIMALTCEHVVLAGQAAVGVKVGQPNYWVSCCCCVHGQIGTVFRAVKNDRVDCALVQLDPEIVQEIKDSGTLNEVVGIGALTGVAPVACFEQVRKRGRTTEVTQGRVVEVLYEGNQILVDSATSDPFADVGDSGSVLVDAADAVIGLVWARNAANIRQGVANHIGEVMRELEILIAGEDDSGLSLPAANCGPPPVP